MATIEAPSKIGNAAEGRRTAAKTAANRIIAESIHQQPSNALLGGETANAEVKPLNYFDAVPHRVAGGTPAKDEAFRDIVSMRDMFGQDNLMGARQWDDSLLEYLAEKRQSTVQNAYDMLALSVFDPLDPNQRAQLERIVPNLTKSKQEVFEMVEEQRSFINEMALRLECSASEWARLVQIIGGGEPLLKHPLDDVYTDGGSDYGGGSYELFKADVSKFVPGLFSYFTANRSQREMGDVNSPFPNMSTTRERRKAIAGHCIHHFPRLLTGSYKSGLDEDAGRTGTALQRQRIVTMCEEVVKRQVPLGQFTRDLQRYTPGVTEGVRAAQENVFGSAMFANRSAP